MSSFLCCGWLRALAGIEGKVVDVVASADVADTVVVTDAVSDLSLQSSHLSLSSLSDSPLPLKSHHKLPSVPFLPKAHVTSPSHATSHHPCISHPSYSAYHITMRALVYLHRFPDGLYMFKAICDFLECNHLVSIIRTHEVQKAGFVESFYISPEVPVGSNCL